MFDKTINKKPNIVDSKGTVIKDLTVPIYKRLNKFNLNYTIKMSTLEHQMRPDIISISEYGSDKHTEDILKLNGISNPFSMDTGQILMIFDEKDIENISRKNLETSLLEPYKRLQSDIDINQQNGYDNKVTNPNIIDRNNIVNNKLPLIDINKPYNRFEVDSVTKKFINPEKLPDTNLNNALDKIKVGKNRIFKEPHYNNDDKNQFTIKDGNIILGPERDKDDRGELILDKEQNYDQIINTENLPDDIKDLIDKNSDCNSSDNKCKDKYPDAFIEYIKNRDLK